ncbi:hypothetical protein Ccar_17880 [Clostridium carboxidivorans P7]|uniref:Uncharacterized protein n=1 Tax=Clostridium carboxidivorans P7 TaxID=536227 RepID=C6Q2Y0_9CLOT|nr:hypothetical protein [Clostridium carboxidivorans]AKN32614.1 hypothetical protein Ccar_17880 [Clostridium carboxidivorans P7]EET84152.1 hypothetical protein CcarbDRAFT_5398 [Clostridium carboxidivorans P7]EFG90170.1 hypothetical protein CLCAR_0376 [Clostridium carboxidivorans P7]
MSIKFSSDQGKTVINYSVAASTKIFDYPFFITDSCKTITNNKIIIIKDTNDPNKNYLLKDFEIVENGVIGDDIIFKLQEKNTKALKSLILKNIEEIELNDDFRKKYYITSDNFKNRSLKVFFE